MFNGFLFIHIKSGSRAAFLRRQEQQCQRPRLHHRSGGFQCYSAFFASVTRYHLEISLHLFWSRSSRRCVQAPLGNDESCSWQSPWLLLAAACQGKPSPERGECLRKSGACLEPLPALKQKTPNNNPSPLPLHQYCQMHITYTVECFSKHGGLGLQHNNINIFIAHVCLHFVILSTLWANG